jgi:hypothetical protein
MNRKSAEVYICITFQCPLTTFDSLIIVIMLTRSQFVTVCPCVSVYFASCHLKHHIRSAREWQHPGLPCSCSHFCTFGLRAAKSGNRSRVRSRGDCDFVWCSLPNILFSFNQGQAGYLIQLDQLHFRIRQCMPLKLVWHVGELSARSG